jgi:8-oxo-dGTP pyrophosphatase MutT (NUDIX family)
MREIKACGVLVIRGNPVESFLLMKHRDRWDLPKGHLDGDESEVDCALRELEEETGIAADAIELDPDFRSTTVYDVHSKRFAEKCRKTLVIFLGRLKRDVKIVTTEHLGFQWFPWEPPHQIQKQTIDPLLVALEEFLATETRRE